MDTALTTKKPNELATVEAKSLVQSVLRWQLTNPVPDELGQGLSPLKTELGRALSPCPVQAYALLLDKLFACTETPPGEALTTWRERLERFPEGVLSRAVNSVIDHHKWAGAPKVAQLVEACEGDLEWGDWRLAQRRLSLVESAWDRQQRAKAPNVPYNPDIADTVQAAAYASQRARVKRIFAEQEQRKAERKTRRPMSREEEQRLNREALSTDTMKATIAREEEAARANVGMET